MKKISTLILITLFISASLISCKKYEEGPALSLRSKKGRLCRTWRTESYSENGVDKTSDWNSFYQNASITLDKNGNYSLYYKTLGISDYNETGTWQFTVNKVYLLFNKMQPTVDTWDWHIIRLTHNEFWIEDDVNSSTKGLLKMIPK